MQQRQVKQGIDAVIVDSVLAIRKGLTSAEPPVEPLNSTLSDQLAELKVNGTNGTLVPGL